MLGELTVLVNIANSIMYTNRILYIRNWHYNLSLSVMGLSLNLSILGSTYLRALTMKGEGGEIWYTHRQRLLSQFTRTLKSAHNPIH